MTTPPQDFTTAWLAAAEKKDLASLIEGIDLFTLEDEALANELKVFVRPLKAANLFAAEMQKALSL